MYVVDRSLDSFGHRARQVFQLHSVNRLTALTPALAVFLAIAPACEVPPYCENAIGVCPEPDSGVYVDTLDLQKSVWFEDQGINASTWESCREPNQSLCLLGAAGFEESRVLLRGEDEIVLFSTDSAYSTIGRIPVSSDSNIEFVDLTGRGSTAILAAEYLRDRREYATSLWNTNGERIWSRESDYGATPVDINNDGVLEFELYSPGGTLILNADGTQFTSTPQPSGFFQLADFDGDGILEAMSYTIVGPDTNPVTVNTRITTIEGGLLAEFTTAGFLYAVRFGDDTKDYLGNSDCQVMSLDGEVIGEVPREGPLDECAFELAQHAAPRVPTNCRTRDEDLHIVLSQELEQNVWDNLSKLTNTVVDVQFTADRDRFRVEFDYTIVEQPKILRCSFYRARKTIMKVFDENNRIVYHEVMASPSGRGSIAVIPSDVEGEEMLLVGDGDRILSYRWPASTE